VPVPPHAHRDATPGVTSGVEPHPVIAAAYAAAFGRAESPARHKAPLRPPSRRAWMAVGLLITLTALPMLVVILAGRAGLRSPGALPPYRADGGSPVVIEPGPDGAHRRNDAAVAPEAAGPVGSGQAAAGAGAAGGSRVEATPCPTASGSGSGGVQAAGGGAPPAGAGSSGGSGVDAGSGAQAGGAPGGGPAAGVPGGAVPDGGGSDGGASDRGASDGGGSDGGGSSGGPDGGSPSGADDGGSTGGDDPPAGGAGSGDQPPNSSESTPGRNFIERVFDELGIPLP